MWKIPHTHVTAPGPRCTKEFRTPPPQYEQISLLPLLLEIWFFVECWWGMGKSQSTAATASQTSQRTASSQSPEHTLDAQEQTYTFLLNQFSISVDSQSQNRALQVQTPHSAFTSAASELRKRHRAYFLLLHIMSLRRAYYWNLNSSFDSSWKRIIESSLRTFIHIISAVIFRVCYDA